MSTKLPLHYGDPRWGDGTHGADGYPLRDAALHASRATTNATQRALERALEDCFDATFASPDGKAAFHAMREVFIHERLLLGRGHIGQKGNQ